MKGVREWEVDLNIGVTLAVMGGYLLLVHHPNVPAALFGFGLGKVIVAIIRCWGDDR